VSLIRGKGLFFRYDRDWVISDLDIEIGTGEAVAIIGPNGSGKTTLLKILSGIIRTERGAVSIEGRPLSSLSRREISRRMALVSQESYGQFPFVVEDVVLMGRAPYLRGFALEGERDFEIAQWAMELTDIYHLRKRKISELSGGERQRAYIARALAQDTGLLLLDEPTAHLDINHQIALAELLMELNVSHKKTIISVTHDINLASSFFDRIVLLSKGMVEKDGAPEEVVCEKTIRRVYGADVLIDINPAAKRPRVTLVGGGVKGPRR
jgi:iron complex transport system ATP-binding protein